MAYYQGDYYQGDYYAGDPFLGALIGMGAKWIGKGIKKVFSKGTGLVPGRGTTMVASDRGFLGPLARTAGTIARTGAGAVGTGMAFGAGERMMLPPSGGMFTRQGGYRPPGRGFVGPPAPSMTQAGGMCCPSGYHLAKDGSGRCVRNRSMNVANPRALRRSLRRVAGFGKLAQRSKRDVQRAARALGK